MLRPNEKPENINFSSGPCSKRPGWKTSLLKNAILGRSHRSKIAKARINYLIDLTKNILQIPNNYLVGIVPGSDTGAVEIAMWNTLGYKDITMLTWDSFGNDWARDIKNQLKIENVNMLATDYGKLPSLDNINFNNDIVFNFNGTTAGVRVPNLDWIPNERDGITICDATSAAFAMRLDWSKLDLTTFSWQKCLGGEAGYGMLIISPKAVQRINHYSPSWPVPKLFNLKKNNELNETIFEGSTINTPSLLSIEDFIDALEWSKKIGGLKELIKRSELNLSIVSNWVNKTSWIDFLSENNETISSTSVCLKFSETITNKLSTLNQDKLEKSIVNTLEMENIANDIGSYRSAPPGFRLWCGPTIQENDVKRVLPWLEWAYQKSITSLFGDI